MKLKKFTFLIFIFSILLASYLVIYISTRFFFSDNLFYSQLINMNSFISIKLLSSDINREIYVFKRGFKKYIFKKIYIKNDYYSEDKICKVLDHENICKVFKAFRIKNVAYLITEYLDFQVTFDYVDQDVGKIFDILSDVMNGLEYLHRLGIAHLDIKMENVMGKVVNGKVIYKLIDFGFSQKIIDKRYFRRSSLLKNIYDNTSLKTIHNSNDFIKANHYLDAKIPKNIRSLNNKHQLEDPNGIVFENKCYGTFPYKPPEIIFTSHHTKAADIWCLGAMALYLSIGYYPFFLEEELQFKEYVNFLQNTNFEYFSIDNELSDFISFCMERNYRTRPTIKDVKDKFFNAESCI